MVHVTLPPACWHMASVQVPLLAAVVAVDVFRMFPAESMKTK